MVPQIEKNVAHRASLKCVRSEPLTAACMEMQAPAPTAKRTQRMAIRELEIKNAQP
jgi:hypothetical protein